MIDEPVAHIHTLRRVLNKGKRTDLFMCMDPICTFERKADHLNGKAAMCPYCNQQFIVTRFKLAKQGALHCDNCSKFKKMRKIPDRSFEKKLEEILQLPPDPSVLR